MIIVLGEFSEEECYELASKSSMENSDQILIEPFHQDLSLQKKRHTNPSSISLQMRGDPASIAPNENPKPLLIEPFHQDLNIPTKNNDSTIPNSIQARGGAIPRSKPDEPIMNHDSSEGESGYLPYVVIW